MSQVTGLAEVLGLPGVEVDLVEREEDGGVTVYVSSAPGAGGCCPECESVAGRVKERVVQGLKHVVVMPVRVVWRKSRFVCANPGCGRESFTETGPLADRGAHVSNGARKVMGHWIGDWMVPVARVAVGVGVAWRTAHHAFVGVAAQAGIGLGEPDPSPDTEPGPGTEPEPEAESGPEVCVDAGDQAGSGADVRPSAEAGQADATGDAETAVAGGAGVEPATGSGVAGRRRAGLRRQPRWPWVGALPLVEVLGMDDHRRGKPLYHRDPNSGAWVADADRWQTVFVDSAGGHGLLGQVEGRTKADVVCWLAAQEQAWRHAVRYVSIDLSTVYKSAALAGLLPNAQVLIDVFHVIQLANKMVADVRRRLTYAHYGRRGRTGDPEYAIKNPLRRGQERLSENARHKLLCTLADLGDAGRQIGAAWRAKELLRDLIRLSPTHTGQAATRDKVAAALEKFFTFAATTGATIPEIQTLAETISTWRHELARAVLTGHSNAAAEGTNRLIKLTYRTAFGFTNVTNQQRRARYAASRSTRPDWLHTATTPTPQNVAA